MGRAGLGAGMIFSALALACMPLEMARNPGPPPADRAWDPALEKRDDSLSRLASERSPWAALAWQGEHRVQSTLGRPLSLPFEGSPEDPPDPEEAWVVRRSPGLARPLLDALGWKEWFKGPEIGFDGRSLRTPLERLEALGQGRPMPMEEGPQPISLRLYPAALLRDRPAARLVLRPNRSLRIALDPTRASLLARTELSSGLEAEAGCSLRFDQAGTFHAHLGAAAVLSAGWRIQARCGTHLDRGTLAAPTEDPGAPSLGLVLTTSCSF